MKTTRRTKIRFEKHELKLIRLSRNTSFFCSQCRTETAHLTIVQTAIALAVSEKDVFRLAERGQIHSIETAHGQLLICADSAAHFEK